MNPIGRVIGWEVWRHLRNKQFLIGLFITPLIFVLIAGVPTLLELLEQPEEQVYGVVDTLGVFESVEANLAGAPVRLVRYESADDLPAQVEAGEIDGFFTLDEEFLASGQVSVYAERPSRVNVPVLSAALGQVFYQSRMNELGIEPAVLAQLNQPLALETLPVEAVHADDGEEIAPVQEGMTSVVMASVFAVLLVFLVMTSGTMLLQSALQEKRDRMIEVVLSSIGPDALMFGKIIGQLILGMLQIAFWLAIGLPILYFALDVPIGEYIDWPYVPLFVVYLLLGYLFFAAIFVGTGATMEDIQSAGNSQGMVFMLPVFSFIVIPSIVNNPDGLIARIATLIPLTSPPITMVRMGMTKVPVWELVVGGVLLVVSTLIVVKLASKIFRVGMLMYGKTATPREILKWLRHA